MSSRGGTQIVETERRRRGRRRRNRQRKSRVNFPEALRCASWARCWRGAPSCHCPIISKLN